MRKVGIVTLNGNFNYGNKLQNYALQEILRFLGCKEVNTIARYNEEKTKLKYSDVAYRSMIKRIAVFGFIKYEEMKYKKHIERRSVLFEKFTEKYISEIYYDKSSDSELQDYDYIVAGSDQIWNPNYSKLNEFYFLHFIPRSKRITYAASFGVSDIPEELIGTYQKYISEIDCLSVREERGQEIVYDLTGKESLVHLDPTLLLTKDEWNRIAKPAKSKPKKPYVLTYFLGEKTISVRNEISQYAEKNNCVIIDLGGKKDKVGFETGPSQFIDFIKDASMVFTDSFHGTVFSIIYETPFIVYDRISKNNMFSRITTLLSVLGLTQRIRSNINLDSDARNIDFYYGKSIILEEKKKSLAYLKKSLDL